MWVNGVLELETQPCAMGHAEPQATTCICPEQDLLGLVASMNLAACALQKHPKSIGTKVSPKLSDNWIHWEFSSRMYEQHKLFLPRHRVDDTTWSCLESWARSYNRKHKCIYTLKYTQTRIQLAESR